MKQKSKWLIGNVLLEPRALFSCSVILNQCRSFQHPLFQTPPFSMVHTGRKLWLATQARWSPESEIWLSNQLTNVWIWKYPKAITIYSWFIELTASGGLPQCFFSKANLSRFSDRDFRVRSNFKAMIWIVNCFFIVWLGRFFRDEKRMAAWFLNNLIRKPVLKMFSIALYRCRFRCRTKPYNSNSFSSVCIWNSESKRILFENLSIWESPSRGNNVGPL